MASTRPFSAAAASNSSARHCGMAFSTASRLSVHGKNLSASVFDVGAVDVGAHHPYTFAVTPIQFSALLFELKLLRSERAPGGNDGHSVLPVEVTSLNGAVVDLRIPLLVQ